MTPKTILLGVTGCIAAYKSCEVVRRLKELGFDVWVVMTGSAAKLIAPLTFRTLSGNPVILDLFSEELKNIPLPHISLSEKADLILVVPATANIIGKAACGIADDALSTMLLSATCPKIFAPAMNTRMWDNPTVQENTEKLKKQGVKFMGPIKGKLACGDEGIGHLAEVQDIIDTVVEVLLPKQDLKGKTILVTAGGTREAIDAVRFISNRSSGKMGYAIAEAALERGAEVILVSANVDLPAPSGVKLIKVESASEMLKATLDDFNAADIVVMAAAVADFKPVAAELALPNNKGKVNFAATKIKKSIKNLKLELEPTEDILKVLSKQKGRKDKIIIGFALETENLIQNAKKKLKEKDLDMIVANDTSSFGSDSSQAILISKSGKVQKLSKLLKAEIAGKLLDIILK